MKGDFGFKRNKGLGCRLVGKQREQNRKESRDFLWCLFSSKKKGPRVSFFVISSSPLVC